MANRRAAGADILDVPDGWTLPELDDLVPDGGARSSESLRLEHSHFDTVRHDLRGFGVTLCRRSGGPDAGWVLTGAVSPMLLADPAAGVPAPIRDALTGLRAGGALKPVARVRTNRMLHRLSDADGVVLLEVAVDDITASEVGEFAVIRSGRQVSVPTGTKGLRRNAIARLLASGGEPGTGVDVSVEPGHPARERSVKTVHGLVQAYLGAQYDALIGGDLELRRRLVQQAADARAADERDAVHSTRVATRRYRAVLHVFSDEFDAERAAALEASLSWYGGLLGAVRDLEIVRGQLANAFRGLAAELALGGAIERVDQAAAAELDTARAELRRALRSRRYFALLAELRAWSHEPPFVGAERSARAVAKRLAKAERKVAERRALVRGLDDDDPGRDVAVHRIRTAAKRARYTAELSLPVLGKQSRSAVKRWRKVQERLGERQDAVVTAAFLRRHGTGEDAFVVGALWARVTAPTED